MFCARLIVSLQPRYIINMAKTEKKRTRKEVLAWLQRARERKQAWQEQTELELKALVEESQRAKETHYFDFAE